MIDIKICHENIYILDSGLLIHDVEKLIEGCRQNNRHCQEKLYKELYPVYYALCKRYLPDKHEALTALNDGMLHVFSNIGKYDASSGDFFAWSYTIVRRATLSYMRKRKDQLRFEDDISQFADDVSSANTFDERNKSVISNLLEQLPDNIRVVCILFYMEDYTVKEIGSELNIKEGTVKWHLHEGRRRLKVLSEMNRQHD